MVSLLAIQLSIVILLHFSLLTWQKSYQEPIDKEFQRRYASVVLELERLNKVNFGVFICFCLLR